MKSFQAVIIAAIFAAAAAANEPVASPTFFKQELAEYEHRLRKLQSMSFDRGTPATSPPTPVRAPTRSMSYSSVSMSYYGGKGGKSGGGKGGKSGSGSSYSTSMSYSSGKGGKSGSKGGKSDGSYSYSASMNNDYNYGYAAGAKATKRQ